MNLDDLVDLAVLVGTRRLRPTLERLSPRAQAEFRDLLTIVHYGYSGYVDRSLSPAGRQRNHSRWPRRLAEDYVLTTTYANRNDAVDDGRRLQQGYMRIEIVKSSAGPYEVHYDEPVPTTAVPFDDAKTFATGSEAIDRARALRAYGYDVRVKTRPSDQRRFCRVTALAGKLGLPTAIGPDRTFPNADAADVRLHALEQVGFTARTNPLSASKFQVEITALPTFPTPGGSVTAPSSPPSPGTSYTVKSGDTLYKIATKHGITVDDLKKANKLTGDAIAVGDVLTIPGSATPAPKAPAPPTPTPPKPTAPVVPTVPPTTPAATKRTTPSLARSSVGHIAGSDWSTGDTQEKSFLRKTSSTADYKKSGTLRLFLPKGTPVTLKSASDPWIEVEGAASTQASGKPAVAAGTQTGWILRDWTTMTLGVFRDLPVDDRTETYGALATSAMLAASAVTTIIIHQTEGQTGASTLSAYRQRIANNSTRGAHYLIDEDGTVILVVPIDKVVSHATGYNSKSIGIEHVGMPAAFDVPANVTDPRLATQRAAVGLMQMSPKFKAGIAAKTDAQFLQFAKDAKDKNSGKWNVYGDINPLQKRASYLLVGRLKSHFSLTNTNVHAHEKVAQKAPGEGENITEYLLARDEYPALVAKLIASVGTGTPLSADPTLAKIVASETALATALQVDATAAENAAVLSKTDAAATARQSARDAFYAKFWARHTQLNTLVTALQSSPSVGALAPITGSWIF